MGMWPLAVLSIRQSVIVAISGIFREVLDEFPVVALGIVEVPALAEGMFVERRGLSVSSRFHPLAQCFHVVHFISQMVDPGQASVWCPVFLRFRFCWAQGAGVLEGHH